MNNKSLIAAVALVTAGMSHPASADDSVDKRWYAAPFGSYVNLGGNHLNRGNTDGFGGGLAIGKMINEHFNVELRGIFQDAGGPQNSWAPKSSWDSQGATADVQYYFMRSKFSPYAVLGVGGLSTTIAGRNAASLIVEPGAGLTYELTDNFLLRSDVRYRYNNSEVLFPGRKAHAQNEFDDFVVNLGFVIPFGAKPMPAKFEFAPAAVAPKTVVKEIDCTQLDDDRDGVTNCLDKCPGTISRSKVDQNGCPVSLHLKGVNFERNSAKLTSSAEIVLDGVATSLLTYPEKDTIEVHGYTSSDGSDAYNMKLSERRSQSVVDYLKMKGINNPMIAKGFGESKPIADNRTEAGRAMNRRVELVWTGE